MTGSNDLSGFSHDMANMLSSASMLVDRLEQAEPADWDRLYLKLSGIMDSCMELCSRTLHHANADGSRPTRDTIRVESFLASVASHAQAGAMHRVAASVSCQPALGAKLCSMRLYRVLFNLLINSVDALAQTPDARIRLSAARRGRALEITIEDNGPGIGGALPKVRARAAARKTYNTGIGLPTAFALAAEMGAVLRLIATDKTGTVFRLTVPECTFENEMALSGKGVSEPPSADCRQTTPLLNRRSKTDAVESLPPT